MILSYGTRIPYFAQICWETQRRYADRIGADFVQIIVQREAFPHQRKLELMAAYGPEKGRILYLDWDVEVSALAQSLFHITAPFCLSSYKQVFPWLCTGIIYADIEVIRAMIPAYNKAYARLRQDHFREERAINQAAAEIGTPPTPINPRGFMHHYGIKKEQYTESNIIAGT